MSDLLPSGVSPRDPVVENISAAAVALENAARFAQDSTSVDDTALALADMVQVKRLAARVYDDIEKHLLSLMDSKRIEVPGVGLVEAKKAVRRSGWRHAELIPVVVARALDERRVDEETGEYEREAEAVARVLRDCISFGAGKVTGLRARGIQPDEFCVEDEAHWSVKLPPRDVEALSASEPGAGEDAAA